MRLPQFYTGINQHNLFIMSFALFGAWHLSFAFEGQVLYALADNAAADLSKLVLISIFIQFMAMFTAGFFVKKQSVAKTAMIASIIVCISGSLIFFLPFSLLWYMAMTAISYFAGLFVASWGFYYRSGSDPKMRLKTAAEVLIGSNILMVIINISTAHAIPVVGLAMAICSLLGSLLLTFRLEAEPRPGAVTAETKTVRQLDIKRPLLTLSVFILILTINAGLMYQVVTPAFAHFKLLTSYYWALPYIAALLLLRRLPAHINKAYILYVALVMLGMSFLLFMWMDRSIGSYLLINTLMLAALGVSDLFWWSILGNMLDYTDNSAQVFGLGLSMNVLGIFIGGSIGSTIRTVEGGFFTTSMIALMVVFASLTMLPLLNAHLNRLLRNHQFLVDLGGMEADSQEQSLDDLMEKNQLTEKEKEVVRLLLQGYTYRAMAEEMFISENTVKYHAKNIYQKLNVNSKMELVKTFNRNPDG